MVITATPAPQATALPAGSVQINGAGATFPLPVYTEWIYAYQYVDPSVTINYQGIGSGGGKKAIIDDTVDFAGSDSLLSRCGLHQAAATCRCTPCWPAQSCRSTTSRAITTTVTLEPGRPGGHLQRQDHQVE